MLNIRTLEETEGTEMITERMILALFVGALVDHYLWQPARRELANQKESLSCDKWQYGLTRPTLPIDLTDFNLIPANQAGQISKRRMD